MIEFSEDGKTVTMPVEKFWDMAAKASKNWGAEMSVMYAHMILHPHQFAPHEVEEAAEAFVHGTREFIQGLTDLSLNAGGS